MAFDRDMFEKDFAKSLQKLATSEKVTKAELQTLSRTVLEAIHETGQIHWVNNLLAVLSPMNKRVAILFFKAFTGYTFDDVASTFTKKNKKAYEKAFPEYVKFMEDPHNNIWTWAQRHIEVEQKAFNLDGVTNYVKNALKKAETAGISQADLMRAIIKGGMTGDAILAVMDELGYEIQEEEAE